MNITDYYNIDYEYFSFKGNKKNTIIHFLH